MGKTIRVFGFSISVTSEVVKKFLESYTGEGAVYAIKVRQASQSRANTGGVPKAYAIVQFTANENAELIMSLASRQRLRHGISNLRAWEMERDIVPKPRTFLYSMEDIVLYIGCQISNDTFSFLGEPVKVSVNFGSGMRRINFILSHQQVEYRLELAYENVWQIELHRPRGQRAKYLLIQLFGCPRVFKRDIRSSGHLLDDPLLNYFKDVPDDQWVRTTDFTPSSCIGQSTGFCLELAYNFKLPNFQDHFPYYKESEGSFDLESGSAYSNNFQLVPIVGPPYGVDLPYEILFKINLLVQNGCLSGPTLDSNFYRFVDPRRFNLTFIEHALDKLCYLKECCYEPSVWLNEQYRKYISSRNILRSHAISLDDGLVYVHRVQVTPCKVYFCGPEINVSNRVLRNYGRYIDNFLRVSYVDEDLEKLYSTDLCPRTSSANGERTEIFRRILSTLRNGIVIGDKKFEFLAFSTSQLRENSAWMFASIDGLTAANIREWMGNFHQIRNVAKYAARLGQSFGSSTETLSVGTHEMEIIPDIEVERGGTTYVFSDGIGKISAEFARRVASKCRLKGASPSAFQIRYGGYKGVVAVDPTSSKKLSLRKSMNKYESDIRKLDVLGWSKYQPCYLNRQIITLLSTLGVRDHAFEKKQREAVDQLDAILTDPLKAQEALELMSPGENTNILKEMLLCNYKPDAEPFLSMMLQTFRASKLLELRTRARIYIPRARSMMGCLDETRTLNYGQVFVQISSAGCRHLSDDPVLSSSNGSARHYIVEGNIVVAKNPCLHPGDVRVLRAVNVPDLHHMVDCVVFPQKGMRPHPNECSGSDLDGDIYFVCWDHELIPTRQEQPMDYNPAQTIQLDHDVTMEEVQEYFTNYIVNDSLGIISNAHTVFADRELQKAMSKPCLELAEKFSIAVDFPKTGVPAEIPPRLHVKEYPDFMEKPDKPTYESHNVIGKLFRAVKNISPNGSFPSSFTCEVARRYYDHDMEVDGFEDYIDDAFCHKSNYDSKLGNFMDYYGITTEAEILSGCIMNMSKSFTKRRDAEAIGMAVKSLRKEARGLFNEKGSLSDSGDDDVYAKASAWYYVTYHHTYWGRYNEGLNRDHFLSFPWCVYDKLIKIKRDKRSIRSSLDLSSLERQLSRGLYLY
ncbi:hypothetical protein Ddye_030351 [Dipteronia dyeriana]|uniref:RNA-dependent RNA polymerase n=1 Tax=Dipteronia dyeriana TaxID=168575 RepID=A0AAD9TG67_9ROSI|nr:hypothetical protein Ddye_030351 [Dipteronia dyeriana]